MHSTPFKSLFLFVLLACLTPAQAEPVAEEDRIPIDLRRTTLVVRDMEKSLEFYRDGLGMKVIYDNVIRNPRSATSDEVAEISRRLIFLRANDDYIGIVGLLHYRKPSKPFPEKQPEPFHPGSVVLLFNTENLDEQFERIRKLDGIKVITEPIELTYPSYDGKGTIPVKMSSVLDPDGHAIELNQLLTEQPQQQ